MKRYPLFLFSLIPMVAITSQSAWAQELSWRFYEIRLVNDSSEPLDVALHDDSGASLCANAAMTCRRVEPYNPPAGCNEQTFLPNGDTSSTFTLPPGKTISFHTGSSDICTHVDESDYLWFLLATDTSIYVRNMFASGDVEFLTIDLDYGFGHATYVYRSDLGTQHTFVNHPDLNGDVDVEVVGNGLGFRACNVSCVHDEPFYPDWEGFLGNRYVIPFDSRAYVAPPDPCGPSCQDPMASGDIPRGNVFWARVDQIPTASSKVFTFSGKGNPKIPEGQIHTWDLPGLETRFGKGTSLVVEGALEVDGVDILGEVEYVAGSSGNLVNTLIDPTASGLGLVAGMGGDDQNLEFVASDDASLMTSAPEEFALEQNQPNPATGETRIEIALPEASRVSLAVYDVLGREVTRLIEGEMEAGVHTIRLDASTLSSGVYVYHLHAGDFAQSRRMLVVK